MTCPRMLGCTLALRHTQQAMAPLTITKTLPFVSPNPRFEKFAKATNLTYQIIQDS